MEIEATILTVCRFGIYLKSISVWHCIYMHTRKPVIVRKLFLEDWMRNQCSHLHVLFSASTVHVVHQQLFFPHIYFTLLDSSQDSSIFNLMKLNENKAVRDRTSMHSMGCAVDLRNNSHQN